MWVCVTDSVSSFPWRWQPSLGLTFTREDSNFPVLEKKVKAVCHLRIARWCGLKWGAGDPPIPLVQNCPSWLIVANWHLRFRRRKEFSPFFSKIFKSYHSIPSKDLESLVVAKSCVTTAVDNAKGARGKPGFTLSLFFEQLMNESLRREHDLKLITTLSTSPIAAISGNIAPALTQI